jgi:signal transduction histidine kinase
MNAADAASRRAALRHQLRTPLNAIIGFAEIIARGMAPDAARQADYAGEILKSARELLRLVDELAETVPDEAGRGGPATP